MKKQEEILADPVEKLKLLLEQGEFELLDRGKNLLSTDLSDE